VDERRQLLKFVFQNLKLDGEKLATHYVSHFHLSWT